MDPTDSESIAINTHENAKKEVASYPAMAREGTL